MISGPDLASSAPADSNCSADSPMPASQLPGSHGWCWEPAGGINLCAIGGTAWRPAEEARGLGLVCIRIGSGVGLVRSGPAAGIFPMVYHDLVRWIEERGYHPVATGREVWLHDKDDITDPGPQVFEIRLPFTRPAGHR